MEIPPQDLTPRKLSQKLVDKHKKKARLYDKEFKIRQSISVMSEKVDQLKHWMISTQDKNSATYKKYLEDKRRADEELIELKKDLKKIYPQFSEKESKKDMSERYNFLKGQISLHKEAMKYWKERMKEGNE